MGLEPASAGAGSEGTSRKDVSRACMDISFRAARCVVSLSRQLAEHPAVEAAKLRGRLRKSGVVT